MPSTACRSTIIFALLATAIACTSCQSSDATRADPQAVTDEITATLNAYQRGRESRDVDQLARLLTDDVDQLTSRGEWRLGRDAALSGMGRSSKRNPGERTLTVERVRLLSPTVALADARYVIAGANDGEDRRLRSTFVLIFADDGWIIAGIRNMQPAK